MTAWYRSITLAMLAQAVLTGICAQDQVPQIAMQQGQLLPLSRPEVRHLLGHCSGLTLTLSHFSWHGRGFEDATEVWPATTIPNAVERKDSFFFSCTILITSSTAVFFCWNPGFPGIFPWECCHFFLGFFPGNIPYVCCFTQIRNQNHDHISFDGLL